MSWLISQALMKDYENLLCSPARAGEFLGDTCSDGEPSAPLSGNPTQLAYLSPDKMTEFSRLSQFGMTFKPLTENRGEELLTSFREVFRARTLAQQDEVQALKENARECGSTWLGSFTKFDHSSSSWKTHQCSLLGDLESFSETWPRSGTMRNGACWERQTLERHTAENESGLWPTPRSLSLIHI